MSLRQVFRVLLLLGSVLTAVTQASALPVPTDILQGIGIDPFRDLDPQVPTVTGVFSWTEDAVGRRGSLGPGSGGQAFDVEGLYAWRTESELIILLSTGFPVLPGQISRRAGTRWASPDGKIAGARFKDHAGYAGDLLVDIGQDGTWDYGISMGAYQRAAGRSGLAYGDLYLVDQTGGYNQTGTYRPTRSAAGPWVGVSAHNLTGLEFSTQVIKVKQRAGEDMSGTRRAVNRFLAAFTIDLSLFPDFKQALTWHWTMECGNDVGDLSMSAWLPPPTPPPSPSTQVPEPATVVLLGAAAAIVGLRRRRRREQPVEAVSMTVGQPPSAAQKCTPGGGCATSSTGC